LLNCIFLLEMQKKEVSNIAYGKRVEHLKSIIKSCGMRFFLFDSLFMTYICQGWCLNIVDLFYSVPPSIYKKVKQVPENKREAHLIKELEEILSKEGLSANPSEKGMNCDSAYDALDLLRITKMLIEFVGFTSERCFRHPVKEGKRCSRRLQTFVSSSVVG